MDTFLFASLFFIFGAIVGSFLNVAILRINTGKSCGGRSGCLSCAHALSWHELIPIVSFFALRARCVHCGSKISLQYPIVELLTAILFTGVFLMQFPVLVSVCALAIVSSLVVIAVYDIYHTIIPTMPLYTFLIAAFLLRSITNFDPFAILYGAAAAAAPLAFLWLVSRGMAMGFGDVKLALGIGMVLGVSDALQALLLAFVSGAVIGLLLIAMPKIAKVFGMPRVSMKSEIPFAPFLILGFLMLFFAKIDIIKMVCGI